MVGYRSRVDERTSRDGRPQLTVALEQGALREWGNLLFHTALVGVLFAVAFGSAYTYRGQAVLVEGQTFTNAVVAYDSFESGRLFDPASLDPFAMRLDQFESSFDAKGLPVSFEAGVTVTRPGDAAFTDTIRVNHPLEVEGGKIYLQGNGYAPKFTVHDADGNLAFSGAVPFLPQDGVYTSTGVVKVPDVTSGEQLGFRATLYPSAAPTADGNIVSVYPQPSNPVILLTAYTGDLGLDTGIPQNVYQLDESELSPVRGDDGMPLVVDLRPGDTITWDASVRAGRARVGGLPARVEHRRGGRPGRQQWSISGHTVLVCGHCSRVERQPSGRDCAGLLDHAQHVCGGRVSHGASGGSGHG